MKSTITVGRENSTDIDTYFEVLIEDGPHGFIWTHAEEANKSAPRIPGRSSLTRD